MTTYTTQQIDRLVNAARAASKELDEALDEVFEPVGPDELPAVIEHHDKVLDELNASLDAFK